METNKIDSKTLEVVTRNQITKEQIETEISINESEIKISQWRIDSLQNRINELKDLLSQLL